MVELKVDPADIPADKMQITDNTVIISNSTEGASSSILWLSADSVKGYNIEAKNSSIYVLYGGYSSENNAINNNVKITDKSIVAVVLGGHAPNGDAINNSINISDDSTLSSVIGGQTGSGNAKENTVTINKSKILGTVYGGISEESATGNTVTITNNSSVDGYVIGGYGNDASENAVTITNGTKVQKEVCGGISKFGDAQGNSVTITNKAYVKEYVYGGYANDGNATQNTVTVSNGAEIHNDFYGGYTEAGDATGNTVTITGDAYLSFSAYGGYTKNGDANGNKVILDKANIDLNSIIGGESDDGNATGNHIYIQNGSKVDANIYGGISSSHGDEVTGNTLHVSGFDNEADSIRNFEYFNFNITEPVADKATMLTVTRTPDGSRTVIKPNVNVSLAGNAGNAANKTISLVKVYYLDIKDFGEALELTLNQGATISYKADLAVTDDNKELNLSIGEGTVNDTGKSVVETRAAAGYVVNNMTDFMLSSGMTQAKAALADDKDATFAPFVAVGGSNSRYETGSHVDVDGWNAAVGFAKQAGNATYGVAVEHGRGDYDSYVGAIHGEGDIKSTGGVLFGQIKNANGVHYDASLRAGRVKSDYKSAATSYDDSATYYGLTLGAGKEISYTEKAALDIYGRYYFTHIADSDASLATGEAVDFDALNSHRIRLGGRYTSEINEKSSAYAGLAWQYEFGGDAEAAINGLEAPTPSLQGHSAIIETGYKLQSGKNLSLDFNLTGWLGKQRGIGGAIGAQWAF